MILKPIDITMLKQHPQIMNFSKDQLTALDLIRTFLRNEKESVFLLKGCGGTGKTTLTRHIVDTLLNGMEQQVAGIAPTHKARKVLDSFLNRKRLIPLTTLTVASFLGKIREHSYIGSKKFSSGNGEMTHLHHYFILDEVSMVSDSDFKKIYEFIKQQGKKLIVIGDSCQIPAISQPLVVKVEDGVQFLVKQDCFVFRLKSQFELKEIHRQQLDSDIIKVATFLRDNLNKGVELYNEFPDRVISQEDVYPDFVKNWKEFPFDTKIIAYTNAAVEYHNQAVRRQFGFCNRFNVGEILTGYANLGWPEFIIQNGSDYQIMFIERTDSGDMLTIRENTDVTRKTSDKTLFFPDINNDLNYEKIHKLIDLAQKVNRPRSSTSDYKKYRTLKDKLIFTQNIYWYNETIYTEHRFRQQHPLLFLNTSEFIEGGSLCDNASIIQEISLKYGSLIEDRLRDNKGLSDQETFASPHCVIEKDMDYGYSITCHKSQASTLRTVYVDEANFFKLKNRKNYQRGMIENKLREQNQLKYVACTRASDTLFIIAP